MHEDLLGSGTVQVDVLPPGHTSGLWCESQQQCILHHDKTAQHES